MVMAVRFRVWLHVPGFSDPILDGLWPPIALNLVTNRLQECLWRMTKHIDDDQRFLLPINSNTYRFSSTKTVQIGAPHSSFHNLIGTEPTALCYCSFRPL